MNIQEYWTEIEAVPADAEIYTIFDVLSRHKSSPFLPIVDNKGYPIGVVRENDLKEYAYGRFGRELIKRQPLESFIRETLVLPCNVSRDDLLASAVSNPNPDGIVLTEDGVYRAVLFTNVILRIFQAHRVETQVRLLQAQKMEAIGTLAGGIAHDLNNILTSILGYAQFMREMLKNRETIDGEMLEQILVSGMRARETVGRILAFSRHQKAEHCVVHLSDMIKEVIRLIGNSLPTTIDVEICVTAKSDGVFINPVEIHQVIMNLCTNAYHAMREKGGHLQVSLSDHHGPLLGWSLHQGPLPEPLLRLTVRDTGTGIPDEILPKIFDPFFTTKKQGEGTGMGLAIAHGVVTRCKGCVSVETTKGRGTAFHVYLPRHLKTLATSLDVRHGKKVAESVQTSSLQSRVRVLYVDDEFQVARLAQRFLSRHCIDVEIENDSTKALSILEKRIGDFDVLVTDQTMPSITGLELANRALLIYPGFPVILCTGYSEIVSPEMAKAAGIRVYMHKPPDFQEMAMLIRECASDAPHTGAKVAGQSAAAHPANIRVVH